MDRFGSVRNPSNSGGDYKGLQNAGKNEGKNKEEKDMNIEEMWMNLIDMSLKVKRRTQAHTQVIRTYSENGEIQVRVKVNEYGLKFPRYNHYYNIEGDDAENEYIQAMNHMKEVLQNEERRSQGMNYKISRWPAQELLGHLRAGKAGSRG